MRSKGPLPWSSVLRTTTCRCGLRNPTLVVRSQTTSLLIGFWLLRARSSLARDLVGLQTHRLKFDDELVLRNGRDLSPSRNASTDEGKKSVDRKVHSAAKYDEPLSGKSVNRCHEEISAASKCSSAARLGRSDGANHAGISQLRPAYRPTGGANDRVGLSVARRSARTIHRPRWPAVVSASRLRAPRAPAAGEKRRGSARSFSAASSRRLAETTAGRRGRQGRLRRG